MRAVQRNLFPELRKQTEHGGELSVGKRKGRRPVDPKRPLHVVFRSSKAVGKFSFHRFRNVIAAILQAECKRRGIRVYEFSNNSNHLHLVIKGRDRHSIQSFLRAFPGRIAMKVTGSRKANALGKFWDHLVFTRILERGRDFKKACAYVIQNELETRGLIPYTPRRKKRIAPT